MVGLFGRGAGVAIAKMHSATALGTLASKQRASTRGAHAFALLLACWDAVDKTIRPQHASTLLSTLATDTASEIELR